MLRLFNFKMDMVRFMLNQSCLLEFLAMRPGFETATHIL